MLCSRSTIFVSWTLGELYSDHGSSSILLMAIKCPRELENVAEKLYSIRPQTAKH